MTVIIDKIYCILIPVKFKYMYYNYAIISSFTFEFLDNTQLIFTVNHCQSAFAMLFRHLSEIIQMMALISEKGITNMVPE